MFSDVETIYERALVNEAIKFKALTFEAMAPEEIEKLHAELGTSFPIQHGENLAKSFVLRRSPTVVLIDVRKVKSQFIEGIPLSLPEMESRIDTILNSSGEYEW